MSGEKKSSMLDTLGCALLPLEGLFKRYFFDCRQCGQCLLSQTGMVCPMNCPKGLRNGPCGGTLDEKCEVYADRDCVWMRIHQERPVEKSDEALPFHAPFNPDMLNTASLLNAATRRDRPTRLAVPIPESTASESTGVPVTSSRLERLLNGPAPILSCEIRAPRTSKGLQRALNEIRELACVADTISITSNHGGQKTLPPLPLAQEILAHQCEPVVTLCGRDFEPQSYLDRLLELEQEGIQAAICLSGDWPVKNGNESPSIEDAQNNFYRMDSAQMLFEARSLRETKLSQFAALSGRKAPAIFTGCAINPFSKPEWAVVSRLKQKLQCGANFVMTQAVCDLPAFYSWHAKVADVLRQTNTPLMVSLPLIGSQKGLDILCSLPGVSVPLAIRNRLASAKDLVAESEAFAEQLIAEISDRSGVRGFHLMTFGFPAPRLQTWLENIRRDTFLSKAIPMKPLSV